jgi:hypothetical protein
LDAPGGPQVVVGRGLIEALDPNTPLNIVVANETQAEIMIAVYIARNVIPDCDCPVKAPDVPPVAYPWCPTDPPDKCPPKCPPDKCPPPVDKDYPTDGDSDDTDDTDDSDNCEQHGQQQRGQQEQRWPRDRSR